VSTKRNGMTVPTRRLSEPTIEARKSVKIRPQSKPGSKRRYYPRQCRQIHGAPVSMG
jgi:hypothetical protein